MSIDKLAILSNRGGVGHIQIHDHRVLSGGCTFREGKKTTIFSTTRLAVNCVGTEIAGHVLIGPEFEVWNVDTGESFILSSADGADTAFLDLEYSPSDKSILAAVHRSASLGVWNTESKCCLRRIALYDTAAIYSSVRFRPCCNEMLLGTTDGYFEIWENCVPIIQPSSSSASVSIPRLQQRIRVYDRDSFVFACISNDGTKMAAGPNYLALIELPQFPGIPMLTPEVLGGPEHRISSICFNKSDSLIISGSYDRTLKLWDVATRACLATFPGHDGAVTGVCFAENERFAYSASRDLSIRVWDVAPLEQPLRASKRLRREQADGKTKEESVIIWPKRAHAVIKTVEVVACIRPIPSGMILM
jgi:WD40 repeat protein